MVGAMRLKFGNLVRLILTVILAVGMLMSSHARMQSHDMAEMAQVVADYQSEIADHGHAHDEIVATFDVHHGHGHDVADHDHNIAFLPKRSVLGIIAPNRANWLMANSALPDRSAFDLHRPPRA
jgi:hypothetical protein